MTENNISLGKMPLKKKKIAIFIGLAFLIFIFILWAIFHRNFILLTPYDVSIPNKPDASGKLYSMFFWEGGEGYLLVLSDANSDHREGFIIDWQKQHIGMCGSVQSGYIPLPLGFGYVNMLVRARYSYAQYLLADWEVNDNDIRFRITDFTEGEKSIEKLYDSVYRMTLKHDIPIAYNEWVILKKK